MRQVVVPRRPGASNRALPLRRPQEGYDHSYFFISTFIDDHIAHHAAALRA
jgi:S-formylglutathione hydrolase FrmB